MPNLVTDLIVNRVDLVEEGANSAAFIELYKRKESKSMTVEEILQDLKPEHAEVLKTKLDSVAQLEQDLSKAKDDLSAMSGEFEKAKQDLAAAESKIPCECGGEADEHGICKACGRKKAEKAKDNAMAFDETETLKSMPPAARDYVETLKAKAQAAEEELRKANQKKIEDEAIAKATTLKSLPIEQSKLVSIIKTASKEVLEVLEAANTAINTAVLGEVGKTASGMQSNVTESNAAWQKIEAEAEKVMKSATDTITKAQAITRVIKEQPELYKQYVDGGAD